MNDVLLNNDLDVERISTQIDGASDTDDIIITNRALDIINQIKKENNVPEDFFLRIGTRGGGCSGMNYSLGFDTDIDEASDRKFVNPNVNLVVDARSLFYLMGVTLDYVEGPEGSGFVFHNPNNAHTCGCHG
jgi:iron-sulfur cluster assembly protein